MHSALLPPTVSNSEQPSSGMRWLVLVCLAAAAVHLVATRLVWADIPLQTDTGIWAYFAARMLDGARLYGDLWESKPPGIFWTFAIVERLFGIGNDGALVWLDAIVTVGVCGVTYRVARCVASRDSALLATCLLSVVLCHRILADWGNNLEKFVAFFEMSALWLILRAICNDTTSTARAVPWLCAGLLCGLAALYKQTGILLLVILLVGLILRWKALGRPRLRTAAPRLILGAALPWVVVGWSLLRDETAQDFYRQVVAYDFLRVTSADLERSRMMQFEHWSTVGRHLLMAGVVFFPAVVGAAAAMIHRPTANRSTSAADNSHRHDRPGAGVSALQLILLYAVLATLVFVIAPHGYGHYLLHAAPPAAVLAAVAIDRARGNAADGGFPRARWPLIALIAALLLGFWQLSDHLRFTADAMYPPRVAYKHMRERNRVLEGVIQRHSEIGHSVLLWPAEHAISYHAARRTPLEMCQAIDIFNGRVRLLDPPLDVVIRRIQADPPDLIVDWTPVAIESADPRLPDSERVLLVPAGGFSLAEDADPEHAKLEGRLLAPFKQWVRTHYGGQLRYEEGCTVYFAGRPWRNWQEYLRPEAAARLVEPTR